MRIFNLILSKIHLPQRRYNSFFGNNTFTEFLSYLVLFFLPPSFFKNSLQSYESKFGEKTGTKFNYAFALGRMALYQGLKAGPFKDGDEILVPAFSCVVVPNAILYAGLKPIYVDIESTYFNFDLEDLKKKISPKTRAIYLQYTFGHLGEVEKYLDFANQHGFIVIEDCAHVIGQQVIVHGTQKNIGSLGLFSFYSTDHSKIISTQLGGMLSTNDFELAEQIEKRGSITTQMSPWIENRIILNAILEYICLNPYTYWIGELAITVLQRLKVIFHFNNELITDFKKIKDYPLRMGPRLGVIGLSQLSLLEKNLTFRKNLVHELNLIAPLKDKTPNLALLRYSFLVKNRENFVKNLGNRFQLGIWFTSIFQGRDEHFEELEYQSGSCPNAEFIAKHIVNFPTHQAMNLKVIKKVLRKNSAELI